MRIAGSYIARAGLIFLRLTSFRATHAALCPPRSSLLQAILFHGQNAGQVVVLPHKKEVVFKEPLPFYGYKQTVPTIMHAVWCHAWAAIIGGHSQLRTPQDAHNRQRRPTEPSTVS